MDVSSTRGKRWFFLDVSEEVEFSTNIYYGISIWISKEMYL